MTDPIRGLAWDLLRSRLKAEFLFLGGVLVTLASLVPFSLIGRSPAGTVVGILWIGFWGSIIAKTTPVFFRIIRRSGWDRLTGEQRAAIEAARATVPLVVRLFWEMLPLLNPLWVTAMAVAVSSHRVRTPATAVESRTGQMAAYEVDRWKRTFKDSGDHRTLLPA